MTPPASSARLVWSPVVSPSTSTVRTISAGLTSLSAMERVALVKVNPVAEPDTVTVSVPSPANESSTGVNVKVPIPLTDPAGMETVKELTAPKSLPAVAVEAATDTDTEVADPRAREPTGKAAVTSMRVAPSPSPTLVGLRVRMISVGAVSLSVMVTAAPFTAVNPAAEVVPEMAMLSVPSASSSSTGVKVKVPVAEDSPAGMVMLNPVTGAKSAASAFPTPPGPATDTATTVSVVKTAVPPRAALTVTSVAAAVSATAVCSPVVPESASALRLMTVGAASSSAMVTSPLLTVNPPNVPATVMVSAPSA